MGEIMNAVMASLLKTSVLTHRTSAAEVANVVQRAIYELSF
jgi:hypothetical protein